MDKALFEAHPEYGRLYTWAAANAGTPGDDTDDNPTNRQGICPAGWHLPTEAEWRELIQVMIDDESQAYSSFAGKNNAATKMKSKTQVGAGTGGESHASYNNGMDVLLVGGLWAGEPTYWDRTGILWSGSSIGNGAFIVAVGSGTNLTLGENDKRAQYSVRCKRN
jgi:uncharacterized protein (TIGR02145 family)